MPDQSDLATALATHLCELDACTVPAPCLDHLTAAGAALKFLGNAEGRRQATEGAPDSTDLGDGYHEMELAHGRWYWLDDLGIRVMLDQRKPYVVLRWKALDGPREAVEQPEPARDSWHSGRAFSGTAIEDACPCLKAPCGLVDGAAPLNQRCPQHAVTKTIRQSHRASDCPGGRAEPASGGVVEPSPLTAEEATPNCVVRPKRGVPVAEEVDFSVGIGEGGPIRRADRKPTRRRHDPGALMEEPDLHPKTFDPEDERRADDAHMVAMEVQMEHDAEHCEGDDHV